MRRYCKDPYYPISIIKYNKKIVVQVNSLQFYSSCAGTKAIVRHIFVEVGAPIFDDKSGGFAGVQSWALV